MVKIDWMKHTAYKKQRQAVQRRNEERSNLSQTEVAYEGLRESGEQESLVTNLKFKLFNEDSNLMQSIWMEESDEVYQSALQVGNEIAKKLDSMSVEEITEWAVRNEALLDDQFEYRIEDERFTFMNSENIQMINRFQSSLNIRYNRYYTTEEQKEKNRQDVENLRNFEAQSYAMSHRYDE